MEITNLYRWLQSKIRGWLKKPTTEEKSKFFFIDGDGYIRNKVGIMVSFPVDDGKHIVVNSKEDAETVINNNQYKINL